MCSFLISSKLHSDQQLHYANQHQKYRGPDATHISTCNGITFLHNLLSITGTFTSQPFVDNNCIAIYNGEIYNYKDLNPDAKSDGECIISTYKKYGESFFKYLDGEFAIALIDLTQNILIFGVDTFGCKPLNFSFDNDGYHLASYQSALQRLGCSNITQVNGNEWYIYNISTKKLYKNTLTAFDIDNEYKKDFNDWNTAFENSIKKKAIASKPIMMGLSEGYDSGTICSSLIKHNIDFKAYSVNVLDPPSNILLWRHGIINKPLPVVAGVQTEIPNIPHKQLYYPSLTDHLKVCSRIYSHCEEYQYEWMNNHTNKLQKNSCRDTYGFTGAGFFFPQAYREGYRICLSGNAGDIIGCKEINQKMRDLQNINYLVDYYDNNIYSCEYSTGIYGIEVRYPYLDVKLWQETFWIDKSIHKHWKSPQRQYLLQQKFPFVDVDNEGKEIFEYVGFFKKMPELFLQYRNNLKKC